MIEGKKLDLACGQSKMPGYIGIDKVKVEGVDYEMDLTSYPWPIESGSVDEVYCSHYIEHIPHSTFDTYAIKATAESNSFEEYKEKIKEYINKDGFILFMNELHRILKPGGKAKLIAPYYSYMGSFGDPTHTRSICDFTVYYLNKEQRENMRLGHYGLDCDFDSEFSYQIADEMTLKSDEVRNEAFLKQLNTVVGIILDLTKRK